jgi:hypothetical protein
LNSLANASNTIVINGGYASGQYSGIFNGGSDSHTNSNGSYTNIIGFHHANHDTPGQTIVGWASAPSGSTSISEVTDPIFIVGCGEGTRDGTTPSSYRNGFLIRQDMRAEFAHSVNVAGGTPSAALTTGDVLLKRIIMEDTASPGTFYKVEMTSGALVVSAL